MYMYMQKCTHPTHAFSKMEINLLTGGQCEQLLGTFVCSMEIHLTMCLSAQQSAHEMSMHVKVTHSSTVRHFLHNEYSMNIHVHLGKRASKLRDGEVHPLSV